MIVITIHAYLSYIWISSYPTRHGIKVKTATIIMPTARGSVPGLIDARVCPPRMRAVVENPNLRHSVKFRHCYKDTGKY